MIISLHSSPLSVTGHPIDGDRLVHFLYVDEAGTSRDEPMAIVAGLLVDPDRHWRILEESRRKLIQKYVQPQDQPGFVFHAKELFSGGKKLRREDWPREKGVRAMGDLLRVLKANNVPIVVGYCRKEESESTPEEADMRHIIAYTGFLTGAESLLRRMSGNELATVFAEDVSQVKKWLSNVHDMLLSEHSNKLRYLPKYQPIRRVVQGLSFSKKHQCPLLQYADVCAFVFRRCLSKGDLNELLDLVFDSSKLGQCFGSASGHVVIGQSSDLAVFPGDQVIYSST